MRDVTGDGKADVVAGFQAKVNTWISIGDGTYRFVPGDEAAGPRETVTPRPSNSS